MKKLTTAATVLGLASVASAQLQGSDTLFEMITDPDFGILSNCPGATTGAPPLTYVGGGSSNGEGNMRSDGQEIAPMSRFLNPAAANTCRSAGVSGCYLHSLDALAVLANAANTDGNGGGVCDTVNFSRTLPSGYTVSDWRSVLRIVYGGQDSQISHDGCAVNAPARSAIGTKNCSSTVRTELVNNWGNLFENNCTDGDCTQLKHAFRRDDVSGTTDVFLELLALPAITAAGGPFCNGTEAQDADPIRRTCDGTGRNAVDGEQVCERDGTLGIVLPMVIPVSDPYVTNNAPRDRGGVDCATSWEADQVAPFCSTTGAGGTFQRVAMPPGTTACPVGALIGGTCPWPKRTGSAAGQGFDCIVSKGNTPSNIPPGTQDARAWNLIPRRSSGTLLSYTRTTAPTNRPMLAAFYRLHLTSQQTGGDRPSVTVGTATRTQGCAFQDSTEQIGCLVEASPCSVGYAGISAANPNAECGGAANRRALALRSPVGATAIAPTKATVRRFLEPAGAACTAGTGDFDIRYPLSRGLWLCTLDGVPAADGTAVTPGSQSLLYRQQQNALAGCFQSRAIVDEAVNATGFITLDDNGATPVNFVACQ